MLNFMLTRLNKDARIVLCGMSSYKSFHKIQLKKND